MVLFALAVTALVSVFSFYMMYTFQRRITVQSVEFNLQLVAGVLEQDLRDLTTLGMWCGYNNEIRNYFLSGLQPASRNTAQLMEAYRRLLEEFLNNRAGRYVRRLVVFDDSGEKLLQVGNTAGTASEPVTRYNVGRIFDYGPERNSAWQALIRDPFGFSGEAPVIPFAAPVYHPEDGSEIGTVFLAATVTLVTDKLRNYTLPEDSELYFSIGETHYRIDDTQFIKTGAAWKEISRASYSDGRNTAIITILDGEGQKRTLVRYPVREGIALTQALSGIHFFSARGTWGLAAALCTMILVLAMIITVNMDRNIGRPVARLRKKIDAISGGDFSPAPDIEWDNELGQVGRGINRMAKEIARLMDTRIADEKNKRDLEYRMLQSQINPHFLYNTLNSIKWMATIQNAWGIAEMTTSLSRLLKTISRDSRKMVPLGDELALLDDYLMIQKYRYGDSITLVKQIDDRELLKALIPRFVLQPLVENAIFHGIEPKGGGVITVSVAAEGGTAAWLSGQTGDVLVTITDDGMGMDESMIQRLHSPARDRSGMFREVGVHNVDERLRYAFGDGYGLSISSGKGSYTTVIIRLRRGEYTGG
jgi:two-component system sensor histidine kinase YesM